VALYVETVAEDVDIEGLLDGLEGQARAERAELIQWLIDKGFTVEQIRAEVAPMLLPAGRIVGNDGVYVSARQICEESLRTAARICIYTNDQLTFEEL